MTETFKKDDPSIERYNRFVLSHAKRNLALNTADGILYATGITLVARNTILPGFIHECVARAPNLAQYENTIVGLMPSVMALSIILPHQLISARLVEGRALVKRLFLFFTVFERFAWLFIGAAIWVLGGGNPTAVLYTFMASMFFFTFFMGLTSPAWRELMAKTTPINRRGLLFGMRDFGGAIGGTAALLAAGWFLTSGKIGFPHNYAILFFGAFAITMSSIVPMAFLKEAPYPGRQATHPMREVVSRVWAALKSDRMLTRYIACRWVLDLTTVANAAFFATKALRGASATEGLELVIRFTIAGALARMVWAFLGAHIADRFGFRAVFATASLLSGAAILAALAAQTPAHFYVAFALSVFASRAMMIGRTNYILELAPPGKRPSYIAIDNMSRIPIVAAPVIGGLIADRLGYVFQFTAGAALAVVAALLFIFVAPEPRRERPAQTVS